MTDIAEVKIRTDLVQLAGRYVTLRPSGRALRALCPFHQERTPSFYVWREGQRWRCFGACAAGGDAYDFLMQAEGLDFPAALRQLAAEAGYTLGQRYQHDRNRELIHAVNAAAADGYRRNLAEASGAAGARRYLAERGVTEQDRQVFQLGYASPRRHKMLPYLQQKGYDTDVIVMAGLARRDPDGNLRDYFHERIIFPIADPQGNVAGFAARALYDRQQPKYLNNPANAAFDRAGLLYGLHQAADAIRAAQAVIVVEGYLDVIAAHRLGFQNVVAAMGSAVSPRQADLLARRAKHITIMPDGDPGGQDALLNSIPHTWASFAARSADTHILIATVPAETDPEQLLRQSPEGWTEALRDAKPLYQHLMDTLCQRADPTDPQQRINAANRVAKLLGGIRDPVSRSVYTTELARRLDISQQALEQTVKAGQPRQPATDPETETTEQDPQESCERFALRLLLQHGLQAEPKCQAEWFSDAERKALCQDLLAQRQSAGELDDLRSRLNRETTRLAGSKQVATAWRQTCRKLETGNLHQRLLEIAGLMDDDNDQVAELQTESRRILARIRELQSTPMPALTSL